MGEAVWAKIKYNPYWPGRIVDPPTHIKKPPRKFCVYFFGTNNFGFVELENTHSYWEYKEKYVKRGRGHMFKEAVRQCEEFIKDPSTLNLPNDEIKVAQEFEFNIKKEPAADEVWYSNQIIKSCTECEAKNQLLKDAEKERKQMETQYQKDKQILQNEIDCLKAERDKLVSKLESYGDDDKNVFEVESLHAHKTSRGKQMFLVRWKNFDCTHDSWVRKEDLNCPTILKNYMKTNKLM
ncbi:hepatoma-derived growth factor-related protein 3-like [Contarinia nasturtii]|uniref:hepatoma-derived growth factor-related protein 3-like n=1 Tax=Contarinia nasturtii TaxID=265458 RepID=UPI0012D39257|nr:hepatoma-derived growth factor-related protein 3-like [Contarinia nasturtii]